MVFSSSRHSENWGDTFISNEQAFEFFFRKYYTSLSYFANTILHNEGEANDIVQDCFVKLWENKSIKERSETVKSLLYAMVRNRCIDLLRKRKIRKKAESKIKENEIDEDFEYIDELKFAEVMRQIVDQIDDLPIRMKRVIKLHFIEGKNYKEIANDLQSTPEAVRKQKARALKIIRQKISILLSVFSFF